MELGGDAVAVYSMQVCKRGPRNKGVMTVFREMSITARDFVHGCSGLTWRALLALRRCTRKVKEHLFADSLLPELLVRVSYV